MELTNFSTFWLQNTTFLLMYGKYICTQSCIFRSKIEKTTSTQSFVVGSKEAMLAQKRLAGMGVAIFQDGKMRSMVDILKDMSVFL